MVRPKKIYVYVDESGQDNRSRYFVVATVITSSGRDKIRENLTTIEKEAQTHGMKWHKTQFARKIKYLGLVLKQEVAKGSVFIGIYKKPVPYFFPILDVIERAIKVKHHAQLYRYCVC